jgi:hypothetical protein
MSLSWGSLQTLLCLYYKHISSSLQVITGLGPLICFHLGLTQQQRISRQCCRIILIEEWLITIPLHQSTKHEHITMPRGESDTRSQCVSGPQPYASCTAQPHTFIWSVSQFYMDVIPQIWVKNVIPTRVRFLRLQRYEYGPVRRWALCTFSITEHVDVSVDTRQYPNQHFPGRWASRGRDPQNWAQRSPGSNPLDVHLWGYMKDLYERKMDTHEALIMYSH